MGMKASKQQDEYGFDEFEKIEHYSGKESIVGNREGKGVYCYRNGDIYDGEWRKGKKFGYGVYTYADGRSLKGWFYKDRYVGKEPNEKLKKKMKWTKEPETQEEDVAEPLADPASLIFETIPDEPAPSYPLASNRISTSHEDISQTREEPSNFRRTKSERRSFFFRRNRSRASEGTERQERQYSKALRESIRKKYGLPTPTNRKNLLDMEN